MTLNDDISDVCKGTGRGPRFSRGAKPSIFTEYKKVQEILSELENKKDDVVHKTQYYNRRSRKNHRWCVWSTPSEPLSMLLMKKDA